MQQGSLWQKWIHDDRLRMIIIFVPPAILVFTVFVMLPMIQAGFFSPWKWSGYGPAPWAFNEATDATFGRWVGERNFDRMFGHSAFQQAVWNSILVIVVSLLIQLPLALMLALMIYRTSRANTIFRLVFFMPYILAEVATGLIFAFALDGNYGLSAWFSQMLGLEEAWFPLAEKPWAFYAILAALVWKYFGFHMMIYIAGLQSISSELLESAEIDGATTWQKAIYIKIPLIWPAITVSIFYSVLGALQVFDLVMPMTAGGPSNSSHTLVSYLYNFGFIRLDVGFGSAVGVFLFVTGVVFALVYRNTVQKGQ
ncbi:carbohydrate ABC transporter permease [Cognatishimia activa]|uniref:Lactose transport system permease protein LacF n=1 Tax=Cognatishimia activa TaxID=1715691 RepID=A0A0P1IMN8_9RHOB|nr:sugar ABC transporter permease [Cognatishimia activa]MEE2944745.1 sugar ABC transporter permease [Pseudomonadota bacterium]CUI32781.1 Lactose transport system permease protein LacF [Cognatishimia activa]CUK24799.1 Lactose transport system permease protein LacF [Cognatishimia activa]